MESEESKCVPQDLIGDQQKDSIISPRFKAVAAMAGWDEEALLIASLVVEDTPDRESKQKKRSDLHFKTPPTDSRRKRRAQRVRESIPVGVLDLDEEETPRKENDETKKKTERKIVADAEKITEGNNNKSTEEKSGPSSSSPPTIPCIDKLREELSCAICLEICFEPSTTTCGHSFCRKCLRSAADKCGKRCPKCRQLISNGRSCTVNTVLWNTIQLLFPQEVEPRKAAGALNSSEAQSLSPETAFYNNVRSRSTQPAPSGGVSSSCAARMIRRREMVAIQGDGQSRGTRVRGNAANMRRDGIASQQDEDAALALRLQREEFMEAFRGTQHRTSSVSLARANMRAMASRAMDLRIRRAQR